VGEKEEEEEILKVETSISPLLILLKKSP